MSLLTYESTVRHRPGETRRPPGAGTGAVSVEAARRVDGVGLGHRLHGPARCGQGLHEYEGPPRAAS